MPYVKQEDRSFDPSTVVVDGPGLLNYAITKLIKHYIESHSLSYSSINDVIGALEGAKLEFYRRVAVPYEEQKRYDNGDVY